MKLKKINRKLSLNKETISSLEQQNVKGGTVYTYAECSIEHCSITYCYKRGCTYHPILC